MGNLRLHANFHRNTSHPLKITDGEWHHAFLNGLHELFRQAQVARVIVTTSPIKPRLVYKKYGTSPICHTRYKEWEKPLKCSFVLRTTPCYAKASCCIGNKTTIYCRIIIMFFSSFIIICNLNKSLCYKWFILFYFQLFSHKCNYKFIKSII